ncbi:Rieske 2Fe-2S domain-containing protein [Erythrobacter jejuensis]|uniref:Rieske 2Fe-2S domain-containing protein n=2 Tax=Parerythrobacter jejuensis TaxID=795812 RepID=A0A845AMZ5_9SPHN|nr:Rieske 2Fe-2S domain-containing protein [Parerythrobacter jejuensis]MXP33025.1 Rieske 2Fe-2S domain-containing protein [Parerythrobacter jejuensis]
MLGRQEALDERKAQRESPTEPTAEWVLGPEAGLDRSALHRGHLGELQVLVRYWNGGWMAHAARCPHALGPLDETSPAEDGTIACPWHGYRFDLATGQEQAKRCGALATYPCTITSNGNLVVALPQP